MDPKGKVALVTGGASGIGLAISKRLLQEGVKGVAICDVDTTAGQQTSQELGSEFSKERVEFIKCDVAKQVDMEDAFRKARERFQGLDIVVNNAGILNDTTWELEVDINVKGVVRGMLLAFEHMGKNKGGNGGVVINMASVGGLSPGIGIPIYSGLKGATIGLTRSFGYPAYLEETGVRVMAACPGSTWSNITLTEDILLNPTWLPLIGEWLNVDDIQPPECVSETVLHMIKHGSHGSIWACVDKKPPQEVFIPHWTQLVSKE